MSIGYDATLGAFTHASPATAIGARATVGNFCYLGLGCRIRDRVTIGNNVTVGMGAVVLNTIPDDRVVIGVPAKDMARGASQT